MNQTIEVEIHLFHQIEIVSAHEIMRAYTVEIRQEVDDYLFSVLLFLFLWSLPALNVQKEFTL